MNFGFYLATQYEIQLPVIFFGWQVFDNLLFKGESDEVGFVLVVWVAIEVSLQIFVVITHAVAQAIASESECNPGNYDDVERSWKMEEICLINCH